MGAIESVSGYQGDQVANAVAIKVLRTANAQDKAVASLLEAAVQTAQQIQGAGRDEQVDTYA